MIKHILYALIVASLVAGCSSQTEVTNANDQKENSKNELGPVSVVVKNKFETSDGVLRTSNPALTPAPNKYKKQFHVGDPIGTRYYYMVNKSDKPISGLMDVHEYDLKSTNYSDYKINFEIGPYEKLFIRKSMDKKIKIKILSVQ